MTSFPPVPVQEAELQLFHSVSRQALLFLETNLVLTNTTPGGVFGFLFFSRWNVSQRSRVYSIYPSGKEPIENVLEGGLDKNSERLFQSGRIRCFHCQLKRVGTEEMRCTAVNETLAKAGRKQRKAFSAALCLMSTNWPHCSTHAAAAANIYKLWSSFLFESQLNPGCG